MDEASGRSASPEANGAVCADFPYVYLTDEVVQSWDDASCQNMYVFNICPWLFVNFCNDTVMECKIVVICNGIMFLPEDWSWIDKWTRTN